MDTERIGWRDGIGIRVIALLTLALLPLGMIALQQNRLIVKEVARRADLTALTLTENAASGERQRVERAFGAARATEILLRPELDDTDRCNAVLRTLVASDMLYTHAGFQSADGTKICSSRKGDSNVLPTDAFNRLVASPRPAIIDTGPTPTDPARQIASRGKDRLFKIVQPSYTGSELRGLLFLTMPADLLVSNRNLIDAKPPLGLFTFNPEGQILTVESDRENAAEKLPGTRTLDSLTNQGSFTFREQSRAGEMHQYAVVPVVPGALYALGVWDPGSPLLNDFSVTVAPGITAFLMWLASLGVAYYAIHRMILRHLSSLSLQMRRFAINRRLPTEDETMRHRGELRSMAEDFRDMALALVRDEAALEASLREKNVLLKEVHHRVRNNLQQISSIMNMQIRRAQHTETRFAVSRLQDRLRALSTIHQNLYQTGQLTRVDAAELLEGLVQEMVPALSRGTPVPIDLSLDEAFLDADQAVPLALMASEIVANVIFSGDDLDGIWLSVAFLRLDDGLVSLTISSPVADAIGKDEPTGISAQLVHAFARQLGGVPETSRDAEAHVFSITFPLVELPDGQVDF